VHNRFTCAHTQMSKPFRHRVSSHLIGEVCGHQRRDTYTAFCVSGGRTPHAAMGQYSGPHGRKRTRFSNNPAQLDLPKVLARTAEIGNGRLANVNGLLEEELGHLCVR